jgi:hypothetical protein
MMPEMNGSISLAVNGNAVDFDGTSSTLSVEGDLYTGDETITTTSYSSNQVRGNNGLSVSAIDGFSFSASWDQTEPSTSLAQARSRKPTSTRTTGQI